MPTTFATSRKRSESGRRRIPSINAVSTWNPSRTGTGIRFISPSTTLMAPMVTMSSRQPFSAALRATSAIISGPPIARLEMCPVALARAARNHGGPADRAAGDVPGDDPRDPDRLRADEPRRVRDGPPGRLRDRVPDPDPLGVGEAVQVRRGAQVGDVLEHAGL